MGKKKVVKNSMNGEKEFQISTSNLRYSDIHNKEKIQSQQEEQMQYSHQENKQSSHSINKQRENVTEKHIFKKEIHLKKAIDRNKVEEMVKESSRIFGIKNLGTTCYLNSLFQALYPLKGFKTLMIRIKDKFEEQSKHTLTNFYKLITKFYISFS